MRRAARNDDNQTAIVSALRAIGCSVWIIRWPTDLLIGHAGKTLVAEVKDGSKPPSRRKRTPDQEEFFSTWAGGPIAMIDSVEAAIRAVRSLDATR